MRILQGSQAIAQYGELMKGIAAEALSKLKLLSYKTTELQLLIQAMLLDESEGTRTERGSISTRAEPVP
jgi:hypothetical protein